MTHHRVANFFRSSSENIASIKSTVARTRTHRELGGAQKKSYAASDSSDDAASLKMGEADAAAHQGNRRLSLMFGRSARDHVSATLEWDIESPPAVFHGDAETSTGALVSGQLCLTVKDDEVDLNSLNASLHVHVNQKKPFKEHCAECANQHTELKRWTFLSHPTTLRKGEHRYPFSILLGGHLPATMDTPLVSISYEFRAVAAVTADQSSSAVPISPIKLEKTLEVQRSLAEPDVPHHSVRVFPPTNIKAGAHYVQVIHPNGTNKVTMTLDGLTDRNTAKKTLDFWRLKKVTWKLEETLKTIAPACAKHAPRADGATPAKKGIQRTETRVLGERSLTSGWKADYLTGDGHIDLEFEYRAMKQKHHQRLRYACDSKSRDGTSVTHALMVELVVSKEWAPAKLPNNVTLTGTGRILRMHYQVNLTEFAGLGVSWDNESPPLYEAVPPSPPSYPAAEGLIDYESLETLDAGRHSEEDA